MTTTPTLTLTAFLKARIAEDEAVARSASGVVSGPGQFGKDLWNFGDQRLEITQRRVLAECEAKRRIVAEHGPSIHRSEWTVNYIPCGRCGVSPCPTLRALAAVYSDHAEFREEWRV